MFITDDDLLCTFKLGAKVVKWVRSIEGASDNNKICTYQYGQINTSNIKLVKVISNIRVTVSVI